MLTLLASLVWTLLGALGAYPAVFVPAAILYSVLGVFVSLRIARRMCQVKTPLLGCLAAGLLFEYSVVGFFACLGLSGSDGVIWPWVLWTPGAIISQTLVSGQRFPDSWLPIQRRWARPGLAWLSLCLLTAPILLSVPPFDMTLMGVPGWFSPLQTIGVRMDRLGVGGGVASVGKRCRRSTPTMILLAGR